MPGGPPRRAAPAPPRRADRRAIRRRQAQPSARHRHGGRSRRRDSVPALNHGAGSPSSAGVALMSCPAQRARRERAGIEARFRRHVEHVLALGLAERCVRRRAPGSRARAARRPRRRGHRGDRRRPDRGHADAVQRAPGEQLERARIAGRRRAAQHVDIAGRGRAVLDARCAAATIGSTGGAAAPCAARPQPRAPASAIWARASRAAGAEPRRDRALRRSRRRPAGRGIESVLRARRNRRAPARRRLAKTDAAARRAWREKHFMPMRMGKTRATGFGGESAA